MGTLSIRLISKRSLKNGLLLLLMMFSFGITKGQTTLTAGTATYNGVWSGGTWSAGAPASGTAFNMNAGTTVNIDADWASGDITLRANAANGSTTLNIASGITLDAGTITLNPPQNNGNNTSLNVNDGNVICTGLNSSNSGGNTRDCKVAITSGVITVNGDITMGNNAVRNDITFTDAGTLTVTGNLTTGTLVGNAATINVGGTFTPTTFTANTSTVNYNGTGAQTISAYNYYNLTVSEARTTNNVTLVAGGNIGVSNIFSPIATFTTGNYVTTNNTINFNGTGAQTIPVFNYNNLTISGGRTTNSVTLANTGIIGVSSAFTSSATFTTGGYIITGSTIDFNGAAQNVAGFVYNNLTLSISGTKTMLAAITVNGNLSINGSANLYTNTFQVTGSATGSFTMESGTGLTLGNTGSGTNVLFPSNFTSGNISFDVNSTVTYQSGGAQTVSNVPTYGNLIIATNGTTKTCNGDLTINGNLSVNGSSTFSMGATASTWNILGNTTIDGALNFGTATAKNISISGDLINATGTINMSGAGLAHNLYLGGAANAISTFTTTAGSGSTVTYNRNGDQTVFGSLNYRNLTLSGNGNKTLQATSTINNTLTLNSGVFQIGSYNLTIADNTSNAILGSYSGTSMVETNGTGYVIRNANATLPILFPIGSEGVFAPISISATNPTTGTINGRTAKFTDLGTKYVSRYWDLTTGTSNKTLTATFTYGASEITTSPTFIKYKPTAGTWQNPTGTQSFGANSFTITNNTNVVTTTTSSFTAGTIGTYFSYQTGNWDSPTTWTSDPGGTTQVGSTIPGNDDVVVVLDGRTVSLPANVTNTGLDISINAGGTLNMATYQFTNTLSALRGKGTLRLASVNFPAVTSNTLINTGEGTVEYNNAADFNLPVAQTTYNNLIINAPSVTATQLNNLTLNGNLYVKSGTYRINDNTAARRQLTINGNVIVDNGASITVGNGVTNSTTNPYGITGGTAPFINYYDLHSHRVVILGDFTNNGTVRFTNLDYPVYTAFPTTTLGGTSGFATVYFRGATNNTLTCNNTTDFYNLVVDKGVDQSFALTVYSSGYTNFRLFGANTSGGDAPGTNPNLKKALWIRTGTLKLQGLSIIPSLSEGTCGDGANPNSDFYVPANGALVLDGPEVIVLSTADDYREVNLAYGVAAANNAAMGITTGGCSSFSILGKLQINNGYFSTRESGGFITWDWASGQFIINGGIVDAKQYRAAGGTGGLASFTQTGGTLILRGRFLRTPTAYSSISNLTDFSTATLNTARSAASLDADVGSFNLNSAANVFSMTGGTIRIYDVCGNNADQQKAFEVLSSSGNINVTGGLLEIVPTTGTAIADPANYYVESTAKLGNFTVNRANGVAVVTLRNYPLTVLTDINITAGDFNANSLDLTIGGYFTIESGTTYTTGANRTIFNGASTQLFTINLAGALTLNKVRIEKPAGLQLRLTGTQNTINITDSLRIISGTLRSFNKTVNCSGNIENNGISLTTTGYLVLNSDAATTIGGDGNGIFTNIELNKPSAGTADVTLLNNITINGVLRFTGVATGYKKLNLQEYNLLMGASASVNGADANRFVYTKGEVGNASVSKVYSTTSTSFTFPIGAPSTSHVGTPVFTPATISFSSNPTTYGTITVVPVGAEHFATSVKNRSLTYYWRVKSENFVGVAAGSVNHSYTYDQSDLITGGGITEDEYVPARFDVGTVSWTNGTNASINTGTNVIDGPWLSGVDYIEGDFTAGDNNPTSPFGAPLTFYSRNSGWWGNPANWSLTNHTTDDAPAVAPGASDIVIIGNNHTITLNSNNTTANTDVRSCANLQIEAGATLDIGYNPGCNFNVVTSHPNGNGLFRLTTNFNSGYYFVFPSGDFSDFNVNLGSTELYTVNPGIGTTYWLPNNINKYGNLIISPVGGSNIIFGNTDVLIYGNCTIKGQNADSWFCPTWDSNYPDPTNPGVFNIPRISKTITINGNMDIQGGSLGWYGGNAGGAQNIVVNGNVAVASGAAINVWQSNTSQSLSIGGNLINNANNTINTGSTCRSYVCFNAVPVIFFGNTNATVFTANNTAYAGAQGSGYGFTDPASPLHRSATIFGNVTVNKGTSQATVLSFTGGNISTPVNGWLTLQNGTLQYLLTDPRTDFTVTTTSAFTIPGTSGLEINLASNANNTNVLIANANSNINDLYLNGKLTIANSTVYVGPAASPVNNNDIEYGGGGLSEIDVQGGTLVVNGQIRMNPASTAGVLKYRQSGSSNVIIRGQAANTTNAKLEVYNTGSVFNMSGTSNLTIVRGGGGSTYGDLYIRAASSSVGGSSTINFTQIPSISPVVDAVQNYLLDANVPLNNLTITGKTAATARNATVTLLISPLVLNGNLTISNANSILDANSAYSVNVTVNGGFVNNGTYNYYTNLTRFNGNVQSIQGSSITNFYNLTVNPITSLSLIRDITVFNNLTLSSGQLLNSTYSINLKGNLVNNANYDGDASVGGVILNGTVLQEISGTGTFGRLELDNTNGARVNDNITLQKNIKLTNGIFNINQHLMTLGINSEIEGSGFGSTKMIASDGVFSNVGLRKYFPIYSGAEQTFTFPMGTSNKYTPAILKYTDNTNVGYIRLNNINDNHPGVIDPTNVLDYFWEIESNGIAGFNGNVTLSYLEEDVQVTGLNTEGNYIAAGLLIPGTNWAKFSSDDVDETNNTIIFRFNNSNNISGEYTAGIDPALPNDVPEFTNIATGVWNNASNWTQTGGDPYTLTGAPNGFIVTIKTGTTVTVNENYAATYRTKIDGTLNVDPSTFGHNLGTVTGNGTLRLEGATFPAGRYSTFFDCTSDGVLEYGGSTSYTLVADLYSSLPRLYFTGTGTRSLPNKDLTICKRLLITGPTLNNLNNRKLTILGTFERLAGAFTSGTGVGATVSFAGSTAQTIGGALGDFTGANAFNNFEINNPLGLTVNNTGAIEVAGNLLLTSGNITTSSTATLTITNTAINCITPSGGKTTSFVNGPLTKRINQGDSFIFPIGKGTTLGNKARLSSTQTGTILWTVEYFAPNSTFSSFTAPISYVNAQEYWTVSAASGSQAVVNLSWDSSSDLTPLMTENGLSDMRVVRYNTATSSWEELTSAATGDDNNGTVYTTSRITIPVAGSSNLTIGCINVTKPRARFNVTGSICGNAGIPVVFTGVDALNLNFIIGYKKGGIAQAPITVSSLPFTLPTDAIGDTYQLTSFTYDNPPHSAPIQTGVVDATIVTTYTVPTTASAGLDQSLCGATSAILDANNPAVGSGLWSVSGAGGTVLFPTVNNSQFNGTNGSSYTLTWTISNGGCTSSDDVVISFPLLPEKPAAFVLYDDIVCQGDIGVDYSVSNNPSLTYTWSYSGSGGSVVGSGNAIEIDFANNALSGTVSVYTTNGCGDSAPLTLAVTVNERPTATLAIVPSFGNICDGDNTEITVTLTGGTSPYEFEITNGTSTETITGATTPYSFTPLVTNKPVWLGPDASKTYTYSIPTVTSANGCSNTGSNTVNVVVWKIPETGPQYHVPNTYGF